MAKKYKIVYNRTDCIGAGACATIYSQRWVMNSSDDRADLVGGKKVGSDPETWEVEFTEEELQSFLESAKVCPVEVIHIYELETGKKVC
ncbi:TPA: ferredoxin [Candidatus Woesearchaeota archaeon]|nr:ferredoxin [Candidatus Woesearchaeota archaeon]